MQKRFIGIKKFDFYSCLVGHKAKQMIGVLKISILLNLSNFDGLIRISSK